LGGSGGPAAVWASAVATLFEATLGAVAGSLVLGLALRDFRLGPAWPALGWLVLLALTSGVVGWLLLTVSLPRLAAWLGSALLLVQPAGSVLLGAVFLSERPTLAQLAGVVLMLGGVLIAARGAVSVHADAPGEAVPSGTNVASDQACTDGGTNGARDKPWEPTIPAT
jgi:drug/metabolite transporter (DMT)-like permease